MSTNPFSDNVEQSPFAFQSQVPTPVCDSYAKQLHLVGILTCIQASLELLAAAGLVMCAVLASLAQFDPDFVNDPDEPSIFLIVLGYGLCGAVVGIVSLLRLASGVMILRRRARFFSIVTSLIGLTTALTGCCSLTSIGLCVYTLIVLIQPSVIEEYARAKAT